MHTTVIVQLSFFIFCEFHKIEAARHASDLTVQSVEKGGHWDFRFCGSGYFVDRFFGFRAKRLRFFGFGVHCGLQIFRFLESGFRFS